MRSSRALGTAAALAALALAACGDPEVAASRTEPTSVPSAREDGSQRLLAGIRPPTVREDLAVPGGPPVRVTLDDLDGFCVRVTIGVRGASTCREPDDVTLDFFFTVSTSPDEPARRWLVGVTPSDVAEVQADEGPRSPTVATRALPSVAVYAIELASEPPPRPPTVRGFHRSGNEILVVEHTRSSG